MSKIGVSAFDILSGNKFVNRPEKLSPLKSEVPEKEQPIRGLCPSTNTPARIDGVIPYNYASDSISQLGLDTSNKSGELTSQLGPINNFKKYNRLSGTEGSPAYSSISSRLIPASAQPKTEFNYMLIRINNYIKICEYGRDGHIDIIKRLNNFIYNNDTFDIEFIELPGLKYNLLGAELGITDVNSFISNDNIEIIQTDDLAKHLRNLADAMNFLKGDTGDNSGIPAVIKDGLATRIRATELREYPEINNYSDEPIKLDELRGAISNRQNEEISKLKKTDPENKVIYLDTSITKTLSDPEPINDGLDAFYSVSDFGRTDFLHGLSGQSPLLHNNLAADGNILNKYVVLYNSQFFNTMIIEKHLYETVITGANTDRYIPEIEVVREIVLSNEFALNECKELLAKQIYYTKDDINKDLDYFMNKATGDYPSLESIRQYIQQAYELDNNCENRIQFKNLCDDIFLNLNVAKKYQECVKRSLPMIFAGLGLEKKRYSEGVFWFGIKRRTDMIYKAREDRTSLTRKLTPEEAQRLIDIEISTRANIDKAGSAIFEKQRILGYLPTLNKLSSNTKHSKTLENNNENNNKNNNEKDNVCPREGLNVTGYSQNDIDNLISDGWFYPSYLNPKQTILFKDTHLM